MTDRGGASASEPGPGHDPDIDVPAVPDQGSEPDAGARKAWPGPRPLLVGLASVLLVAIGLVELLLATLVLTAFGVSSLALTGPTAVLGVGSILLAFRIRDRRNRQAALGLAFVTMVLAPPALGVTLLGLGVSISAMVVIVALVHHRVWFKPTGGGP